MSNELTIAIIASGASLIVAIVSLISSIISNRQSAHTAQTIETLKNDFVRQQTRQEIADKNLDENLKSLHVMIQSVQRIKDEVQLILSAMDSSLDSESAIARVSSAREELFANYESSLANLNHWEADISHDVKNQSLLVENVIRKSLYQKPFASQISYEDRQHLLEIRNLLTDAQNLLRDSRTERITRRIEINAQP